jgi:hypothetical protein
MEAQVRQETAALMRGEVNIQSQLASMLQRTVEGPLDQWVQKHKQSNDLIAAIGEKLKQHFPYQSNDTNELTDEISFNND